MYLALFLAPWVLMYAASTFVMNHRGFFQPIYGERPTFTQERELPFQGQFAPDATPKQKAAQILAAAGFDGAFTANARADGTLVVQRLDLLHPRRLTFDPAASKVTIERQVFTPNGFLERFHRRRGFQFDSLRDDVWAVTVDAFIVAMLFWALSGLWMWWELRVTRGWGTLALVSGAALFTLFLFAI